MLHEDTKHLCMYHLPKLLVREKCYLLSENEQFGLNDLNAYLMTKQSNGVNFDINYENVSIHIKILVLLIADDTVLFGTNEADFWSFEISDNILRNQKYMIGLDSYSRQFFLIIWTPFWLISVFESTAYLKFAKLQYVSSGFRCRVITGSLMRLY